MSLRPGPLALVGGEEFQPGNEAADETLVAAAERLSADRASFVVATAAARQDPDRAVRTAVDWFGRLGLNVEELPARRRGQLNSEAIAAGAREGRFFYLTGGDPGYTAQALAGSAAWNAIMAGWRQGAPLAGSSAGAMAFGEWTLIRARMPGDSSRQARPALGLVPGVAVVPHFDRFGHRWVASAREALPDATLVGIDERTAAVWCDGDWLAVGPGAVTVLGASGEEQRFGAGMRICGLPPPRA